MLGKGEAFTVYLQIKFSFKVVLSEKHSYWSFSSNSGKTCTKYNIKKNPFNFDPRFFFIESKNYIQRMKVYTSTF